MKIRIIHFGKIKNKDLGALTSYYHKLAGRFFQLELKQLKDNPESKVSLKMLNSYLNDQIILLDDGGKEFNSKEFSNYIFNKMVDSQDLTFVIGNAFGFDDELKNKFNKISLSKLTLPHELSLVVFLEQLYRAGTIMKNMKYHK